MEKVRTHNPILAIKIIEKSFGNNKIIKDLELSIYEGEIVSIIGRSGIGKSSLLKLIAGIDLFYKGDIVFDNTTISSPTKEIALMFQGHILLPWLTVKGNIKFICNGISNEEIKSYLDSVGIGNKIDEWPNKLSGGEKTRVGLSVALINKSRLLLLDEPFSDIDIGVKNGIIKLLNEIKVRNNTTILMTTHNIDDALYLSDRIVVFGNSPSNIVFDSYINDGNKEDIRKTITNILTQ